MIFVLGAKALLGLAKAVGKKEGEMGERNSERRGLLICTAVLFSFCLFFFIFYGKEIIVNGSQAGEEYVKELMGGEEYAALEQRVQQILHAEKFSLTDYIRAVLSGETAFSFSDFVRTDPTNYFHWVYDHRRFYSCKQNNNYSLTLNE